MGVVYSSVGNPEQQHGTTPNTPATSFATPLVTGAAALVWAKHSGWDASRVAAALTMSAKHLSGARPNTTSGYGRLDVRAALRAIPPPDLDEPNDWASAARRLRFLTHGLTVAASVGGSNDPLDAYPIATKGKSVVTIGGQGAMQAYLVRSASVGSIDAPASLQGASSRSAAGRTVHLRVPGKGSWFVVVTAPGSAAPVGYTLRLP
jgi:Subtilase family